MLKSCIAIRKFLNNKKFSCITIKQERTKIGNINTSHMNNNMLIQTIQRKTFLDILIIVRKSKLNNNFYIARTPA